jgi:type IV secretory pathway VirB9-like protein
MKLTGLYTTYIYRKDEAAKKDAAAAQAKKEATQQRSAKKADREPLLRRSDTPAKSKICR